MPEWTWDRLESAVEIVGERITFSQQECDACAVQIGLERLPPSYCEYLQRFGAGTWLPDLTICVPSSGRIAWLDLPSRLESFRGFVEDRLTFPPAGLIVENIPRAVLRSMKDMQTDGIDAAALRRLLCFGDTSELDYLCWDPAFRDSRGEMRIRMVSREIDRLDDCGNDLLEFLGTYWIDGKLDEVFGYAREDGFLSVPAFQTARQPENGGTVGS